MGVDLLQGTAVAEVGQLVMRQGIELGLGDAEVLGDLLGFARRSVRVDRRMRRRLDLEEIQFLEELDEAHRLLPLDLVVVAEFDAVLGVLAGLAIRIEEGQVAALDDELRGTVDAQDRLLGGVVIGEDEGIAADVGRNIDPRVEQAILPQEHILLGVQPHHRQGRLVLAHEDDRVGQAGDAELGHCQRNGVADPGEAEGAIQALDAQALVQVGGERLRIVVEKDGAGNLAAAGERCGGRHGMPAV